VQRRDRLRDSRQFDTQEPERVAGFLGDGGQHAPQGLRQHRHDRRVVGDKAELGIQ
jgi:hypothetical protein